MPSRARSLFAGILAAMFAGGCSTSRMAVDVMTPILENTTDVALRSSDPQLVGDALPTSLLLLEGMLETHPKQRDVASLLSMLYFAYGFAFVEPSDPVRASGLYARGAEVGWIGWGRREGAAAIRSGTFAELGVALEKVSRDDAAALLWVAANWGMWIQQNLHDPKAAADFARLVPLADKIAGLDEGLFWGMPRVLLGAMHASRPVLLGGNPERSADEFARAEEISEGNLLLAKVFFAKTYCVQAFDREAFEASLHAVLDAPTGMLPDAELLNQIARIQAKDLLARADDIFE